MLQWMGGSRRKVSTSRNSTQKRQKQYFEQKKRQQQYQQHTVGLDVFDTDTDTTEERCKEQCSLDVISMLNLSKIAQECRSSCPSGLQDLRADASNLELNNSNCSSVIQSGSTIQPSDFQQFKEARIPSASQIGTESPRRNSSARAPNSHSNAPKKVNSKPEQCETTSERPMCVLDLLVDDNLDENVERNIPDEAHVAFSVEGLGKSGRVTPNCSPQQSSRAFPYGLSSSIRHSEQSNISRKFNYLLDDLETEDVRMQDNNFPVDKNHLDFSSDYMDFSSGSLKKNSFAYRDTRQPDGHVTNENCYFNRHKADTFDVMSPLQYDGLFDERGPDISGKARQSRMDDVPAENLRCRDYDPQEFPFEGHRTPTRASEKVRDKFDILGSTSPVSNHVIPEYNSDFLVSNWSRHPIGERKFDNVNRINQPTHHFTTVPDDAMENSSLHSEESCTSTAVRHQASNDSLSNATSRSFRRRHDIDFSGSGDKNRMKAFSKGGKKNGQTENISTRRALNTNFFDPPDYNAQELPSPLFKENFETKDNWLFEERPTEVDINPRSNPFNRNPEAKQTEFNTDEWNEDPFGEIPARKSQFNGNHQRDGSYHDPFSRVKSPSPTLSMPEATDFSFARAYKGDTLSPDISPRKSISKDFERSAKLKPSNFDPFDMEEDIFNGDKTSKSMSNDREGKESEYKTASQWMAEGVNTAFSSDPAEETSPFENTTYREKKRFSPGFGVHRGANKFGFHGYQNGIKESMEDFGPKVKMSFEQMTGYAESPRQAMMMQSYVLQLFCVRKKIKY